MSKRVTSVSCVKFATPKPKQGSLIERAPVILPALAARKERCTGDRTTLWMVDKWNRKNNEGGCLAANECHNIRQELAVKDIYAGIATDVDESKCTFFA